MSCAFLNTEIEGPPCIMRPPPCLIKLGLAEQDELWWAHRSIYGRRKSPKEWKHHRDETLNDRRIPQPKDKSLPELMYQGIEGVAGVWRVVAVQDPSQVYGLVVAYADDCLITGDIEAAERIIRDISAIWKVKCQGLLAPPGVDHRESTDASGSIVAWKEELTFLGLQICMADQGIRVCQTRWIAQALRQRGFLHLSGSFSLPNIEEFGKIPPAPKQGDYDELVKSAQTELGSLLWVAIRSRLDVMAVVGALASQTTITPKQVVSACKQVWRYLRATWSQAMLYTWGDQGPDSWCSGDASFAPTGGRSRSGVVLQRGAHIRAWKSERQKLTRRV